MLKLCAVVITNVVCKQGNFLCSTQRRKSVPKQQLHPDDSPSNAMCAGAQGEKEGVGKRKWAFWEDADIMDEMYIDFYVVLSS